MKTRKLKKVWNKLQQAQAECRDLEVEFQRERTDMLDTIRELTRQLKLKSLVISNFVLNNSVNSNLSITYFIPQKFSHQYFIHIVFYP